MHTASNKKAPEGAFLLVHQEAVFQAPGGMPVG